MKRLFLSVLIILISVCAAFAQDDIPFDGDREHIRFFDVTLEVQPDGMVTVTENITVIAKHFEIKRGITRDLPDSRYEKATPVFLTMDGKTHPFFIESEGDYMAVNFGNDDYISEGKHTYSFTYSYRGAINFFKNYNELYWNVTGNDWTFYIRKARIKVILPEGTKVIEKGISLYTGKADAKENNAKQNGNLTFETTALLHPQEGFTVSIPFEKGTVNMPPLLKRLITWRFFAALILFAYLIYFCISTWRKYGHDPFYAAVPQYEPPKGISPAFVCFDKGGDTSKRLTCAVLDMAMRKHIRIEEQGKDIILHKENQAPQDLPEEEKMLLDKLFSTSADCKIGTAVGTKLEAVGEYMSREFRKKEDTLNVYNSGYKWKAFGLWCLLGFIPLIGDGYAVLNIFLGVFFLPMLALLYLKKTAAKLLFGIVSVILLYLLYMIVTKEYSIYSSDIFFAEILVIISVFVVAAYIRLIPNVTQYGKEYYDYIKGFEKYVTTAEARRVELSNPADAERIFSEYLPYAYAMGLSNEWMQMFTSVLSAATIQESIERVGEIGRVSHHLSRRIGHSMPVHHSSGGGGSSRSSGSFGGGHSGGGHGGGGGHGR